jgi:hypothetical protein
MSELQEALVSRLYRATTRDAIEWEPTADENTFLTSIDNYTITINRKMRSNNYASALEALRAAAFDTIEQGEPETDDYVFALRVFDSNGREVEFLRAYTNSTGGPNSEKWVEEFSTLYFFARRKALGADEALRRIVETLGSLEEARARSVRNTFGLPEDGTPLS